MAAEDIYARLKPYNPKRGFKLRRYSVFGVLFHVERGWYRVEPDVAEYLKTVRQDNNDPDSKPGFDVCPESEMKKLVEAERKAKLRAKSDDDPVDTALDVRERIRAEAQARAAKRARATHIGEPPEGVTTTGELPNADAIEIAIEQPDDTKEVVDERMVPTDDLPLPGEAGIVPPDDLTKIDGVGVSTARKLHDAGFTTFKAIADAELSDLTALVDSRASQIQEQAKQFGG